jgi:hypothetical protein
MHVMQEAAHILGRRTSNFIRRLHSLQEATALTKNRGVHRGSQITEKVIEHEQHGLT